jgi:hypothetical protein
MDNEQFFKDRYFKALSDQLEDLKDSITDLKREVADIKSKVVYMYGFAAALGFVASFAWKFIESLFTKQQT